MVKKITAYIGGIEGFVGKWYLDPVHIPTMGFGFTWQSKIFREWWLAKHGRKFKRGDTISKADALIVLQRMIDLEYGPPVQKAFAGRPEHVRDAGTSMILNCGAGALKWRWAQAIMRGDIKEGCRLWRTTATTARGKKLPGLVRRRREEATIAEMNIYPSWMGYAPPKEVKNHVAVEDITQAQTWLQNLDYYHGQLDGIVGKKTISATKRFQADHGTLRVDGIIGTATLSALQRANDFKTKSKTSAAGGTAAAGGGAATDWSWASDVLLWGGLAVAVIGLGYLAYRYRDEVKVSLKKFKAS